MLERSIAALVGTVDDLEAELGEICLRLRGSGKERRRNANAGLVDVGVSVLA